MVEITQEMVDRLRYSDEFIELVFACDLPPSLSYAEFYKEIAPRIKFIKKHGGGLDLPSLHAIANDLFIHYVMETVSPSEYYNDNEALTLIVNFIVKRFGHIEWLKGEEMKPFVAAVIGASEGPIFNDTLYQAYQLYHLRVSRARARELGL